MAHGITRYWYGIFIILVLLGCDNEIEEKIKTEYITNTETVYVDHDFINVPLDENQYTITLTQEEIDKINNGEILYMRVFTRMSSQGNNWQSASTSIDYLLRGCFGGRHVAVGNQGEIFHSQDGITWTSATTTNCGTTDMQDVAFGDDVYVAVGMSGKIVYSSDCETWTVATTTNCGTTNIRGVTYANGKFVAVGDGIIVYSTDGGDTWTEAADYGSLDPSGHLKDIASGGGLFVTHNYTQVAYSTDGDTWVCATTELEQLSEIEYGNGLFVIVGTVTAGANALVVYSSDGDVWTTAETYDNTISYYSIAYAEGKFFSGASDKCLYSSSDANEWTKVNGYDVDMIAMGLHYGNGCWVAVGSSVIAYSLR